MQKYLGVPTHIFDAACCTETMNGIYMGGVKVEGNANLSQGIYVVDGEKLLRR